MEYFSDKRDITPSVFDRLIDDYPHLASDSIPDTRRNPSVRVVADKPIELSGLPRVDGVKLVEGDRVLVVAQFLSSSNGVYSASDYKWDRVPNSEINEFKPNSYWDVDEGSKYGKTQWYFASWEEIVPDESPILIKRFHPVTQFITFDTLKNLIARDLAAMLNTRCDDSLDDVDGFNELRCSLLTYGTRDFSSYDPSTEQDINLICAMLKKLVNDFEPRLKNVNVWLEETQSLEKSKIQDLHFRLDAYLGTSQEQASFDTVFLLTSKSFKLIETSDG